MSVYNILSYLWVPVYSPSEKNLYGTYTLLAGIFVGLNAVVPKRRQVRCYFQADIRIIVYKNFAVR